MTQLHERFGTGPRARATAGAAPGAAPGVAPAGGGDPPSSGSSARLPGLFASWDTDGYCRMASDGHEEWFGLSPDQMVGRHISEVLGERLYALNRPYLEAALAGHERVLESSVRDPVGRERYFEVTYVPDRGPDGRVRGVYVQAMDVTTRVRAQASLADAQEMVGLGSWCWERGAGFAVSQEMARIIGRDLDSWAATAEGAAVSIHGEDLPWLTDRFHDAVVRGEGWKARHRIVRPDGDVRHVHSRARVEVGTDGRLLRIWGRVLDVTAQARLQEEVEFHNERLADTMAMLGHDVRQPLTAVLGYLDEARQVMGAGDADAAVTQTTVRDCVDRAARSGTGMRRLVDDILAVVSVDSGTLVARPERVSLAELLEAVVEEVRVEVAITGAGGVRVGADLFHLRQALTNVLANATKYGKPPFEVSVRVDGDGVPPEFVCDLFGRFARGAGIARGDGASTGLGLHLVRSLVEANGGTVRYAGVPGLGARFLVSLPAA